MCLSCGGLFDDLALLRSCRIKSSNKPSHCLLLQLNVTAEFHHIRLQGRMFRLNNRACVMDAIMKTQIYRLDNITLKMAFIFVGQPRLTYLLQDATVVNERQMGRKGKKCRTLPLEGR